MNIYISKKLTSLYFYENTVMFPFDDPKVITSDGIAFVSYMICKGTTDITELSHLLVDKFKLTYPIEDIEKAILSYTIYNETINEAFTTNGTEANTPPQINGVFGMRYPEILHIELTGACNFNCSHCYKKATYNGEYINFDLLKSRIYDRLKNIVPVIHFTGGEPTLHREFEHIVNLFRDDFELQLSTNASNIYKYPISLFKNFQAIDISLYGLSSDEYKRNVGNDQAFEVVKSACKALSNEKISFRNTIVLNSENWSLMERYIQFSMSIGANSIAFSSSSFSGKLLENQPQKWILTQETKRRAYILYRELYEKYKNEINIIKWERNVYSTTWKNSPSDGSIRCGAGKNAWWMSEIFKFKPCTMLPDKYMNLDYNSWFNFITGNYNLNWHKARNALELFASENNCDITDLCAIFRK